MNESDRDAVVDRVCGQIVAWINTMISAEGLDLDEAARVYRDVSIECKTRAEYIEDEADRLEGQS